MQKIKFNKYGFFIYKNFDKAIIKELDLFINHFISKKLLIWQKKERIRKITSLKNNLKNKFYHYYLESNKTQIFRNPYFFFYNKIIFNLITNEKLILIIKNLLKSETFYFSGLFNIRLSQ